MRIKTLCMENFRQFRGSTKIDFSCDPQKNVTLILGDNTFGKTTLLQAFIWCFYGKSNFTHKPTFLLNYELAAEMNSKDTANVEVEVTVVHSDIEYIITRTQTYIGTNNSYPMLQGSGNEKNFGKIKVSYKDEDGQTKPIRENKIAELINDILPEELSNYFFFDTERVNTISARADVSEAVKGLLGLSIIDNAVRHLGDRSKKVSVIGKIYGKMDVDSESKAKNLLNQIKEITEKRTAIAKQIKECSKQISKYDARKDKLNLILRENQMTAQLQSQKESLEKKIADNKKALADTIDNYFKEFNIGALPFFAQPLLRKISGFLQNINFEEDEKLSFSKTAILELINRHRCICGQEFQTGDEIYQHLIAEMNAVPTESLNSIVNQFKDRAENFYSLAAPNFNRFKNLYESFLRLKSSIQELEYEIDSINEKISDKADMNLYVAELKDIQKKIQELNSKKDRLHQEDGVQKNEMDRCQKSYDALLSASGNNKELLNFIGYAEKIREYLDSEYKNKEIAIRENLEVKVNEIFSQMYSGKRRVKIDEEYNVHLLTTVTTNEIDSGESEGLNCVKNFAFGSVHVFAFISILPIKRASVNITAVFGFVRVIMIRIIVKLSNFIAAI